MSELTTRFRQLHDDGLFIIPNPWDQGSARYLEWRGFPALATTSSGFAATLGRLDQQVTRDELVEHVAQLCASVAVPINVDAERCYAEDVAGVAETVRLLGEAGAAGFSIEDYDPATGAIDDVGLATELVAAAAEEARRHDLVLTARTEGLLYGSPPLDEIIARLSAYRDAGAEVVYAPGLDQADDIARVVAETGVPVNVLPRPNGPTIDELTELGVRRVSTGGGLAWAALGGLKAAVDELADAGTFTFTKRWVPRADLQAALGPRADDPTAD